MRRQGYPLFGARYCANTSPSKKEVHDLDLKKPSVRSTRSSRQAMKDLIRHWKLCILMVTTIAIGALVGHQGNLKDILERHQLEKKRRFFSPRRKDAILR